ncbi:thioesterase family protein [Amycolatopsis nigrescens]|uniref:thioesterase family protein n=1 Tax=Amycolatopsis nigrescens TaxID=381445 RepID=UPI00038106BC|nr:thioesterase family protein [Amycolatopsis nigrescens]
MGSFTEATAVVPRGSKSGTAVFDTELDPQWAIGTKLHGGYLLAILARAAAEVTGPAHPQPTAVSGLFSTAPDSGPAVAEVEVLRAGRGVTQVRARLSQHDRPCVEALITQGTLSADAPAWSALTAPELPPEQDCVPATVEAPGGEFKVPLMEVVTQHLDPGSFGADFGTRSAPGCIQTWQRLADGTDWDPLSLLVALDPVPPVSYQLGLPGWAPTVQLSAYLRALPAPGPVRVRMTATEVTGDRMDEVAHVWDATGRLVAQATQLAGVRLPG